MIKRIILAITLILMPTNTFSALTEVDRALVERGKNLLKNPGFESGLAQWSASGGSFTLNSTAAHVAFGNRSAAFDASASSQTVTSTAVSIPAGLYGANGVASCKFKTTATDYKIQSYDGTNVLSEQTISSSSTFIQVSTNFPIPTSGNIQMRVISASNAAVIYIDDCYLGQSDGFNYGNLNQVTAWNSNYTYTTNNLGTISNSAFKSRRVGDSLEGNLYWTNGTVSASAASISLPTGIVIDSSKSITASSSGVVGIWVIIKNAVGPFAISSTDKWGPIFFDGSDTGKLFFAYQTGSNILSKANGTDLGNNENIKVTFSIPVVGWQAEQVFKADQQPQAWSGYHDGSDCSWSTTSASYADPSADASCTFTERYNLNFGSVSSHTSGGNKLPGITFTPPSVGSYLVCARVVGVQSAGGSFAYWQLYDGTNVLGVSGHQHSTNTSTAVCGIYNATSASSATVRIRMISQGGNTHSIGIADSNVPSVDWSVARISQNMSTPFLVGTVISSNSTNVERSERVLFGGATKGTNACGGSPCTVHSQSGDWVSSVTRSAAGRYTVNFTAGKFSTYPTCTCSGFGLGLGDPAAYKIYCSANNPSTSSVEVATTDSGDTARDTEVSVICNGPR